MFWLSCKTILTPQMNEFTFLFQFQATPLNVRKDYFHNILISKSHLVFIHIPKRFSTDKLLNDIKMSLNKYRTCFLYARIVSAKTDTSHLYVSLFD